MFVKELILQVWNVGIKIVKDFRQSNGLDCSFPVLFRKINHSRPESHFDFDKSFIAISQEVFGFSGVNSDHTKQQMSRSPQGNFHLVLGNWTFFRKWPKENLDSMNGTFGCRMSSTDFWILVSNTWAFVSFLSQWAASQIRAKGPFLARTKWA